MAEQPQAFVYDAIRTPRGKGKANGSLHEVKPVDLVVGLLDEVKARNPSFDPERVDDVVLGVVTPIGDQGADIAKTAALAAGYPETVAGVQLNRFCASGLEAVNQAAMRVRSTIEGYSREDVDTFATESQARAAKAQANGYFDRSVVPVKDINGLTVLDKDEFIRPGTTVESLAGLKPSFAQIGDQGGFDSVALEKYHWVEEIDHVHHAGNSSGIVDGATIMLTGPAPASRKALAKAGLTPEDIDLYEINEAFAAVAMRFMRDLDLPHEKVNVNGGAIAMGHPLGATGAMILGTLIDELERRDLRYGLATLCVGGGMGIATVVERI